MTRVAMVRLDEGSSKFSGVMERKEGARELRGWRRRGPYQKRDAKSEFHASVRLNYSSDLEDSLI